MKFSSKITAVVIFPRRISKGIKNGIVIKSPRIEPFFKLREFPNEKKFMKIRLEIIRQKSVTKLSSYANPSERTKKNATNARGTPIRIQ